MNPIKPSAIVCHYCSFASNSTGQSVSENLNRTAIDYYSSPVAPFTNMVLTLIPAWISNHMSCNVWEEITYPFLTFNGCTVEV